jgi:hypothetical protein
MPRRPLYADRGKTFGARMKAMFTDPRTWSTVLYMLLMLPVGVLYFSIAITGLCLSLELALSPIIYAIFGIGIVNFNHYHLAPPLWATPLTIVLGVIVLCGTLHLARGVGRVQGGLAKHFLVKTAQY